MFRWTRSIRRAPKLHAGGAPGHAYFWSSGLTDRVSPGQATPCFSVPGPSETVARHVDDPVIGVGTRQPRRTSSLRLRFDGSPRGVAVTRRDVTVFFAATSAWAAFPDDVSTLFHSYGFDFSVSEIFGARCSSAGTWSWYRSESHAVRRKLRRARTFSRSSRSSAGPLQRFGWSKATR